jgi:hypothetical protein
MLPSVFWRKHTEPQAACSFRPTDASGEALKGPKTTKGGKPWNIGRQYFSSFKSGDMSSFIWADGVKGMEPEAQQDFNEYMGGGGMFMF